MHWNIAFSTLLNNWEKFNNKILDWKYLCLTVSWPTLLQMLVSCEGYDVWIITKLLGFSPASPSNSSWPVCQTQCYYCYKWRPKLASLSSGSTSLRKKTGEPQFSMHISSNMIIVCTLVQLKQFSLISFIISVGMPHYKSLPVAVLGQTALLNLIFFFYQAAGAV